MLHTFVLRNLRFISKLNTTLCLFLSDKYRLLVAIKLLVIGSYWQVWILRARPAVIVGFWAIAAASFANFGYVSMRTLAQINDCMTEHSIDLIAQVWGRPVLSVLIPTLLLAVVRPDLDDLWHRAWSRRPV